MLNPYVLLALFVGALGLFGSGVSIGVKWERNDTLARIATAQDTAIKAANAATEAEVRRTVAAAKAEADARITASAIRNKGELDALRKSRAACARDAESMGLLQQSIDAANGKSSPAVKLPDPVRSTLHPLGWLGTLPAKLGVQGSGAGGAVSETTR